MEKTQKKDSLIKNTVLLSIGTIMTKGLLFVMVPFFSRWLTVEDYGTFDLYTTYVMLLIPLIGLASNEALFRFSIETDDLQKKREYSTNCFLIYIGSAPLIFIVLIGLRYFAGWMLALDFFLLLAGETFMMYLRGFLRGIKRLDIYSFASIPTTIMIAILSTIFIRGFQLGLRGIILGYGLGYVFGDILIVILTKYWTYLDFSCASIKGIKQLVSYSIFLIPNSIAWWFINVSDRTIIKLVLGPAFNGIYAVACKVPNILSSVFDVFGVSWQQSATENVNEKDRNRYYNQVYNNMMIVLLSLCCGILSLNSWIFLYVFEPKYYDARLYTAILIGGTVFSTLSQFYGGIQISLKQPKENGRTTIVGAVVNLVVHISMVKFVGLFAAAISTIVSQMVVCMLRREKLKKDVPLYANNTAKLYILFFVVYSGLSFYINNMTVNVLSTLGATGIVLYANHELAMKVFHKFIARKKI